MSATDAIPRARGALPVIGHGLALLRDPLAFLKSLPPQRDIVEIQVGTMNMAMVCDPELVYTMMRNDRVFDKGGLLFERGRELLGNGLITCPHRDHRRQRRLLQPAFHQSRMRGYGQVISEQIATVLDTWTDGQVLDVVPAMKELTTRITAAALFTTSLPAEQLATMAEDAETFSAGVFRRMLLPPLAARVPTPANVRYNRARQRLRQTIGEIIAEYRSSGTESEGLLHLLMGSRDAGSAQSEFSDAECADQAVTIFFAGIETAAITLAWALDSVAESQLIRRQLYNEVDRVLAGRVATYDDLPELQLSNRVVTETFRMHSPTWLITRVVTAETELGGYRLPVGKTVGCSPLMTHRNPRLHADPDTFDPDRWEHVPASSTTPMIPFGAGARKCIGDGLAVVETTLVLASIAARWNVEFVSSGRPKPSLHAFHVPKNLKLKITARKPLQARQETAPQS